MTLLIGLTSDQAFAADVEVIESSIDFSRQTDNHFWEFTGTDGTSTLTVTLECGNTGDTSKSLDPILFVISPSTSKSNDDGLTPCDSANSSIVTFIAGEVEDGLWITASKDFSDGIGPYTLTLTLTGPGEINQVSTSDKVIVESSIVFSGQVDTHLWQLTGTDGTSRLIVTLVCGNTGNPNDSLDPVLDVISPSTSKNNDDGFTDCDVNSSSSSIVTYSAGEVEDGSWTTESQDFDAGTGPYTLTLTLTGPGEITLIESPDPPVSKVVEGSIDVEDQVDTHFWVFTGTDETSVLTVTLVCGNTGDPTESLDPVLEVFSPSTSKDSDDDFSSCELHDFESSIVTYDEGEVDDGCWTTRSQDHDGGTGPYTLTLGLGGPGEINQVESCPTGPPPASGTIFGAAHNVEGSASSLYTIDRSTGAATLVGPIFFNRCSGMDFDPTTLILYGTCQRTGDTTQQVLVRINTSTGQGTEVGPFDHEGRNVSDISFRNSDNTLYAYLVTQNELATIDTATGALTEVGLTELGRTGGNGMAFSLDDILFHAAVDELNTLNQTSGEATFEADMDYPNFDVEAFVRINGMDFDPSSGELFASINNKESRGPRANFFGTLSTNPGEAIVIGKTVDGLDAIAVFPTLSKGGGGPNEPPTIGKNSAGTKQMVENGICIDAQCWTVIENFHEDFELVEMLTSPHTISNTIYCANGVDKCNHITLSAEPYGTDVNSAIWMVSLDKSFEGKLTVTKDDPDNYLGDTTCTAQIIEKKYWGTSCTIDFLKPTPGMMLGVQVWDTYGGVRNFYFNDGIEVIDTYGYPSVDTEFESLIDVPRLCLVDNPDKRTSCAFAEKIQLEIERAEKLLEE